MPLPLTRRQFAVPLAGLALAFAAPPAVAQTDDAAPARSFVGPVANAVESARVGVVADAKNYVLYVCSTDEAFNKSSARWARGAVANGAIEGKSPDGAMTVSAIVAADAVKGTINVAGKAMAFTATAADERTYAGVYRCEEKDGPNDYVAGWVVDEDDFVAGNVQNRQNGRFQVPPGAGRPNANGAVPGTQQGGGASPPVPPAPGSGGRQQPPRGGNNIPNLNPGTGTGVTGQQVTNPQAPPTGATKKVTPEEAQANIGVIATNVERRGGAPLLGLTIQQVRRFLSRATPQGPIETKSFARLARIPVATLNDYLKDWDRIPKVTRDRIVGARGVNLSPNTPLTVDLVRQTLNVQSVVPANAAPQSGNAPQIASVRFTQFQCVNPADLRKDEVFYTCLVASGTTAFDNVSDIYRGIRRGDVKNFSARDSQFWPRFNTSTRTTSEISIGVGLYDDDSGIRAAVVNLLTGLGDVAGDIAANGGLTGGALANGFQNFLEGTAAAVGTARFLGSDTVVIRPNRQAVDANGSPKSVLQFNKGGNNPASYRFTGLQVN